MKKLIIILLAFTLTSSAQETRKKCILGIGLCDNSNKCGLHDKWVNPRNEIYDMYKNFEKLEIWS